MEHVAPIPDTYCYRNGDTLAARVDRAVAWVRKVRREGSQWELLPKPTVAALYPNMKNNSDAPWSHAKQQIAERLEELTLVWQVGPEKRRRAHDQGIFDWRDPACCPDALGIAGQKYAPILQTLLEVNRATHGPAVLPCHVTAAEDGWRTVPKLEFYVDFETVSDLDDDFDRIPQRGGQPLIFMIGCGHCDAGIWRFECFVVDQLLPDCEASVIESWLDHMESIRQRLAPTSTPQVFHWSPAEESSLTEAYNAAVRRHPGRSAHWNTPQWFDLLQQVVKAEPVVVRGALGFGLKAIAQALYAQGLIETNWASSVVDGLAAMVAAWNSAAEAREKRISLRAVALMQEIARYNEVDCRVMMEILAYLRSHH